MFSTNLKGEILKKIETGNLSPREWQMEYGIMAQRYRGATRNLSQKGRSWYLAKYRRANPKKEGVDIWQSTDGQTPKWKELIFNKSTDEQI